MARCVLCLKFSPHRRRRRLNQVCICVVKREEEKEKERVLTRKPMFALSSVVDSDIGWPIGFLRRILPESLSSSTFGIDRQRPQVKDIPLITAAAAATISSRMIRKVYPEERGRDWGGG